MKTKEWLLKHLIETHCDSRDKQLYNLRAQLADKTAENAELLERIKQMAPQKAFTVQELVAGKRSNREILSVAHAGGHTVITI